MLFRSRLPIGAVGAEDPEPRGQLAKLAERGAHLQVERMPDEHGIEPIPPRRGRDRPGGQQRKVDLVTGERLQRSMQRAGLVVRDEAERRPPFPVTAIEPSVRGDRDETRVGLRVVADVLLEDRVERFDASDSMPPEIGAALFWTEITNWIRGATTLEAFLATMDEARNPP